MRRIHKYTSIFLSLISFHISASNESSPPLKLLYFEREPLYIKPKKLSDTPTGIVIDVVSKILENYSTTFSYTSMPPKRQLSDLLDKNNHCGIGWFKNSVRETSYKFSYPIFFDGEMYLLGNITQKEFSFNSISDILNNDKTKILVHSDFSYGEVLDSLFKGATNIESLNNKQANIVAMVDRSRGHFTVVSREEKNFIEKSKSYKNIYFIKLNGISNFSARYFMCSKAIDSKVFDSLNFAILKFYENQKLEFIDNAK